MKVDLATFDLTKPAEAHRLGALIGSTFGREVILPLLKHIPLPVQAQFFASLLSYPAGAIAGAIGNEATVEMFAQLSAIAVRASADVDAALSGTRH